jgi:hypothetical protein
MPHSAAKLSVSVPIQLAKTVRKRVGARGLSGFVARAMQHELEREQLGAFLHKLDADLGPVSKATMTQARRLWHRR